MNEILFIGGIGTNNKFGGELTKNKFIVNRLRELSYKVISIDTHNSRKHPRKLFRLLKIVYHPKAPIIFSTSFKNIAPIVKFLHKMGKRNMILWAIGGDLHIQIRNNKYKKNDILCFRKILVEGNIIKNALNDLGINNAITVPNFKQISYLPNIENKKLTIEEPVRFIFFSRIIPHKGINEIIAAAKELNQIGLSNKFLIDFYGPFSNNYSIDNEIFQIPNIKYCGILDFSRNNGYDILSKYHITLFPTHWKGEGFPGVIIDSFISGLPIIATKWGLNSELINNENGFLIEPFSISELRDLMKSIICRDIDLNEMFKVVQSYALKYDVKSIITNDLISNITF